MFGFGGVELVVTVSGLGLGHAADTGGSGTRDKVGPPFGGIAGMDEDLAERRGERKVKRGKGSSAGVYTLVPLITGLFTPGEGTRLLRALGTQHVGASQRACLSQSLRCK